MQHNTGRSEPRKDGAEYKFSMIPHAVTDHGLSPTALALYVVLMRYADNDTKKAFPKRQTLADKLGMKKADSIDRYVAELRNAELLSIRLRWRNAERSRFSFEKTALCKLQTSSEYTLSIEPLKSSENRKSPGRPATRSGGGHGPSETGTNYTHVNETKDKTLPAAAPRDEMIPDVMIEEPSRLSDDWTTKPRHRRRAEELEVDIEEAEQNFREQMCDARRTSWDGAFMRYLDSTSQDREHDEFPSGIRDSSPAIF
jgi:hypothetical protein